MTKRPAGWASASVADVAEAVRGLTYKKEQARSEAGEGLAPLLRATNVQDGRLLLEDHLYFIPEALVRDEQWLQPGDIVLASSSGSALVVGKSAAILRPWRGTFGAFCTVLRPSKHVDPRFLAYFVASPAVRSRWSALAAGTNINNLKSAHIADTEVPLPPLNEQRRVVAAIEEQFSRLDAADTSLSSAQGRLALLRGQAVELAFIGDWSWTTLGEIAEIAGGVTKDAKREGDPSFVEVPYLRVANVQRGFLDLAEVSMIRVSPEKAKALALQPGDVLFNEGGDRDKLGRGWVWSGEVEGCIHQNHVFRARLHDEFEPKFVSWHGNMFGRGWFQANGRQTTNLASLNLNTLKRFPVPAPPLEEQRRIVTEVEQQLSLIDAMHRSIEAAKRRSAALRRSILERAFRGELVPQDPTDEPASALLERVAAQRAQALAAVRAAVRPCRGHDEQRKRGHPLHGAALHARRGCALPRRAHVDVRHVGEGIRSPPARASRGAR